MNEYDGVPANLLRHLADSEFEVVAWDRDRLRIQVTKEIGLERGLLEFVGVSYVSLPPALTITSLRIGSIADHPVDFFSLYRPHDQRLDPSEKVYLIEGSWGERFMVIAESAIYHIVSE